MAFSKATLDYTYILFLIHYIFYELWEDDLTEISYYLFFFLFWQFHTYIHDVKGNFIVCR